MNEIKSFIFCCPDCKEDFIVLTENLGRIHNCPNPRCKKEFVPKEGWKPLIFCNKNDIYPKSYYQDDVKVREWRSNDLNKILHREDGPAIEYEDGSYEFYLNGKHHREDGPAIVHKWENKQVWKKNDEMHREDGPAYIKGDDYEWWLNGVRHRPIADGPAVKNKFGEEFIENGVHHHKYIHCNINQQISEIPDKDNKTIPLYTPKFTDLPPNEVEKIIKRGVRKGIAEYVIITTLVGIILFMLFVK